VRLALVPRVTFCPRLELLPLKSLPILSATFCGGSRPAASFGASSGAAQFFEATGRLRRRPCCLLWLSLGG